MRFHKKVSFIAFLILAFLPQVLLARGGGGGSGGGGGGFGGGSSGSIGVEGTIVIWLVVLVMAAFAAYLRARNIARVKKIIQIAAVQDRAWDESAIIEHVRQVFVKFQNDWSSFGVDSMKEYLSEAYWKRMTLELAVLQNEHRQNLVQESRLTAVTILAATDDADNSKDSFTAQIDAQAHDVLMNTETNEKLFTDTSSFTEYWDFVRDGNEWRLDRIRQATEDIALGESAIKGFAERNNFFYDPDFGWLMMPNRGAIFSRSNFKTSDINNHVVGSYRGKIVEFYTFIPNSNNSFASNYVVAQVVLPIKYKDILVRRRRFWWNFGPWSLRRVRTESNDFEKKFCLWAHPEDQVNSFELLTPNFMEKVYELPFELNIEIVGSFLYFYAKDRKGVSYDKMLEILSWAFDEMRM